MNEEIIALRHCRVVFGPACSPFLLAAIIKLHLSTIVLENTNESKRLAEKLKKSFYVDNCHERRFGRGIKNVYVRNDDLRSI